MFLLTSVPFFLFIDDFSVALSGNLNFLEYVVVVATVVVVTGFMCFFFEKLPKIVCFIEIDDGWFWFKKIILVDGRKSKK